MSRLPDMLESCLFRSVRELAWVQIVQGEGDGRPGVRIVFDQGEGFLQVTFRFRDREGFRQGRSRHAGKLERPPFMKGGGGQVELRKMALDEIPGIVIAQNGLVQKLFHPFRTVFLVQQAEHQRAAGGLIGGVGGGVQFLFRFQGSSGFLPGS